MDPRGPKSSSTITASTRPGAGWIVVAFLGLVVLIGVALTAATSDGRASLTTEPSPPAWIEEHAGHEDDLRYGRAGGTDPQAVDRLRERMEPHRDPMHLREMEARQERAPSNR